MRKVLLLSLLPLAACARDQGDARLRPDAQPSLRVAEAAMTANAPEVALNVARNLLKTDPYNVPAQLAQGAALYAVGDLAQAATSYRTVLAVQPRSAEAQLGLGRVHLARDEAREAETAFRASLALGAAAPAWSNLGIALDMQNRHADAQAAYREALRLDPRNEGARSNLAVSMAMAGGGPAPASMPATVLGAVPGAIPGAPMRLSAADPMMQPFAAEPQPMRRRGRPARDAVAAEPAIPATPAPSFAAPAPVPPASDSAVQLVAMPTTSAPAPDPVAQMVQVALAPGGQGLLASGTAPEEAPRPARRPALHPAQPAAAPVRAPEPAPGYAAQQAGSAASAVPARAAVPAAPAPMPVVLASAPVQALPPAPARIPPAPAAVAVAPSPAPQGAARPDRFDPGAVPMPVVPPGARPPAMAPMLAERAAPPEEGRWLRASR